MSQKNKESSSCRSGEISSGVERNVSEVHRQSISPDLHDELSLYFWDIPINPTTDRTWSTRWAVFVLMRHSYQQHYWSHLIYKRNFLCTSETFLSTPPLISPDLQDELALYFWDVAINTTTDLTWSTRWTVFLLLRHSYQHHYWSHLIYKRNFLCTSETFLSTPLPISPDLQDGLSLYFWDIPINTTRMSQKYKENSSCRSVEINSGVDRNVSEVERQFIL
jgi:hypothetical protein